MPITNFDTCVDQSKNLLMFAIIDIFKFCMMHNIFNFPYILQIDKIKLMFMKLRSQKYLDTAML